MRAADALAASDAANTGSVREDFDDNDNGTIAQNPNANAVTSECAKSTANARDARKKGKRKLNSGADNFLPSAQTRKELVSLAKCNKNSNNTEIPNAETCLSRTNVSPVVEGTCPKNSQGPMRTGPSWRSIVAQRRGTSADKWWVQCTSDATAKARSCSAPKDTFVIVQCADPTAAWGRSAPKYTNALNDLKYAAEINAWTLV